MCIVYVIVYNCLSLSVYIHISFLNNIYVFSHAADIEAKDKLKCLRMRDLASVAVYWQHAIGFALESTAILVDLE